MNSGTDWGWPLLGDMSWAFWIESLFSSWESSPSPKIVQYRLISMSAFQSCPAPLGASMSLRPFQTPVTTGILEPLKYYSCSGFCFKRDKLLCQPSRKHCSFVRILTKRLTKMLFWFFFSLRVPDEPQLCPRKRHHIYLRITSHNCNQDFLWSSSFWDAFSTRMLILLGVAQSYCKRFLEGPPCQFPKPWPDQSNVLLDSSWVTTQHYIIPTRNGISQTFLYFIFTATPWGKNIISMGHIRLSVMK